MAQDTDSIDFSRLGPAPGTRMAVGGGCGGIGRRFVEACVGLGAEVTVLDLPDSIEKHPVPAGVNAIPMDVLKPGDIDRAYQALGKHWDAVEVLVHLPGFMNELAPVDEIEPAAWDETVNVNLRSAYLAAKAGLPLLRKAKSGTIILAASGLGVLVERNVSPYAASKAGVIALAKALAKENAPSIRVNAIAPGAVDTAFLRGGTGRGGDEANEKMADDDFDPSELLKTIPMARIAVPDDVVGPMLFLAGDASRYMTGQVLYINGGRLMP